MYMIVFVTAVVAVVGVYSQLFMLQALRLYSMQTGIAQTMMTWHAAAVGQATNLISPSSFSTAPCVIGTSPWTYIGGGGLLASQCQNTVLGGVYLQGLPASATDACVNNNPRPCTTYLPQGYQTGTYEFYSIVYQDTSAGSAQNYVLTFVPPPVQTNLPYSSLGLLCLPGIVSGNNSCLPQFQQTQLSVTLTDLYAQLRAKYSVGNYGTIQCNPPGASPCPQKQLATPALQEMVDGAPVNRSVTYTLPESLTGMVPVNSVAIISAFSPCASC
jgi:hypothetical protein